MQVLPARAARSALLAALLVGGLVSGCAVGERHRSPDEVTASVQDAGEQAGSAVATVRTAVVLLGAGRLAVTTADTAQADSVKVLEEATRTLTTLAPPDPGTGRARDDVLAAVQDATTAVVEAGAWITASGRFTGADRDERPDAVVAGLDDARAALDLAITGAEGATA